MDISIIGAGGVIGRQIAITLIQKRIIPTTSRLQLVGRRGSRSEKIVYGLAADLADGCAEILPEIDVAVDLKDVLADIIIVAAGRTVDPDCPTPDRHAIARDNVEFFRECAAAIEKNAFGEELLLVLSNPVELGVKIFSEHHDRHRVIGMGGFLDTLRFRREIAAELGIRRQAVQGLVLGEHGAGMVPCWSTVSAFGFDSPDGHAALDALRRSGPPKSVALQDSLRILNEQGAEAAYAHVQQYPADVRTLVKPFITQFTGQRTPVGSAEMVSRLVEEIVEGRQMPCATQVKLEGEFLGIHGVTGAPVILSAHGIEHIDSFALLAEEEEAVRDAANAFHQFAKEVGA